LKTLPKFRSPPGRSLADHRSVIQLYGKDGLQIAAIDGVDLPVVASDDGALRPLPPFSFIKQSLTLTGSPLQPSSIRFCDFAMTTSCTPRN